MNKERKLDKSASQKVNMEFKNFSKNRASDENIEITPELAYLLGTLRDGCFTMNKKYYIYRIRLYQKNKRWIEKLKKVVQKCFNKKPLITQDKRDLVWCLTINSKTIYQQLIKLSNYPGNQRNWTTPQIILESSIEIQKEYLKGFFDSEGGVPHLDEKCFKKKDIRIYFCQANKKSLEELRQIILRLGITPGKVSGPYFKKGYKHPVFALRIHGVKEVVKFYNIVGSFHPEKIKRLKIIEDMTNYSHGTP